MSWPSQPRTSSRPIGPSSPMRSVGCAAVALGGEQVRRSGRWPSRVWIDGPGRRSPGGGEHPSGRRDRPSAGATRRCRATRRSRPARRSRAGSRCRPGRRARVEVELVGLGGSPLIMRSPAARSMDAVRAAAEVMWVPALPGQRVRQAVERRDDRLGARPPRGSAARTRSSGPSIPAGNSPGGQVAPASRPTVTVAAHAAVGMPKSTQTSSTPVTSTSVSTPVWAASSAEAGPCRRRRRRPRHGRPRGPAGSRRRPRAITTQPRRQGARSAPPPGSPSAPGWPRRGGTRRARSRRPTSPPRLAAAGPSRR